MILSETKVYGARLKNREVLLASSSGGAFTALSDVFLDRGNAVVCSAYNFNTHQQEFNLITTKKERDLARGSKYVQSIIGDVFKTTEKWLKENEGRKVLFVGMGCQAAGFKSYAEAKGFSERVAVVDIICHGSSSPKILRDYAEMIEKNGKIEALEFKDKRNGWRRPTAFATINGREISLNSYVKIFYNKMALRPSCHKCPYATIKRKVDITIGDFWHIEKKSPEHYDNLGTSLILVHTDVGEKLFEDAKISLDWFESNTADCWQWNLEKPTPEGKGRNRFWKNYYKHGIVYIVKKYGKDSLIYRIKRKIKSYFKNS